MRWPLFPKWEIGSSPGNMVFANFNRIYVANAASNTVSIINTASDTKERDIFVYGSPGNMVFDPVFNKTYVTNIDNVSVINNSNDTKERDIFVYGSPGNMAVDSVASNI